IPHAYCLRAVHSAEPQRDAVSILLESNQFTSEFNPTPEFRQSIAHNAFGQELGDHQGYPVGLGCRVLLLFARVQLAKAAVGAVVPDGWIDAPHGYDPVKEAKILKDLLCAWLDALTARAGKGLRELV